MSHSHASPQDAEDAYYDALEDGDLDRVMAVWDDSDEISCLLPMQGLVQGRVAVRAAFAPLLGDGRGVALSIRHLQWVEGADLALHWVEEAAEPPPGRPAVNVYAINVYRRGSAGWCLLAHQNAPAAPPPGMMPPLGGPG
jgi:ketosteroid isomerase-like protein